MVSLCKHPFRMNPKFTRLDITIHFGQGVPKQVFEHWIHSSKDTAYSKDRRENKDDFSSFDNYNILIREKGNIHVLKDWDWPANARTKPNILSAIHFGWKCQDFSKYCTNGIACWVINPSIHSYSCTGCGERYQSTISSIQVMR